MSASFTGILERRLSRAHPLASVFARALASGAFVLSLGFTAPLAAAPPPGTPIQNTADANSLAGGAAISNTVTAIVQGVPVPPTLAFRDAAWLLTQRVSPLGQPLWVEASALGCGLSLAAPDTITITLRSRLTGDVDAFLAIETGAATATFRIAAGVPTVSVPAAATPGDGVLTTRRGDEVTAELPGCGATLTTTRVWIEPFGVVFDARTGSPVPDARIDLIDVTGQGNGGFAGGAARVWQDDGVTPAPSTLVSDGQGRFQFPRVAASTYRLVVAPPAPFVFPAPVAPTALAPGFVVDPAGSYGAPFAIAIPDAPVLVDLPVDGGSRVTLFAEKTASRPQVEIGEALEYAVRIANRSDSAFAAATVHDVLPPGFAYLPGSAKRDGAALADPAGTGPTIDFAIGALANGEETSITYGVRVGAGAAFGEALNRAVARAGSFESNEARARVRVEEGLFAQSGVIVGVVRMQQRGGAPGTDDAAPATVGAAAPAPPAAGVAGVRVWLDDGTFAITDAYGRYSFTGVSPRTHALKVDPATLPKGAKLIAVDHRDSGQPGLRFVDLVRGDLQRAEFTMTGDSVTTKEVGDRLIAAAGRRDDLARTLGRGTTPLVTERVAGDPRALPATALTTGETHLPLGSASPPAAAAAAPGAPARTFAATGTPAELAAGRVNPAPALTLDQLARTLDPDLGFVGLADYDTVASPQVAVRVKGPIGTVLSLRVNGQRISESRVGLRVTSPKSGVEAWEYVGIALEPGVNVLEVAPPGSIGRIAMRVVAPGPLARLECLAPARAPADGRTPVVMRLRATDAQGLLSGARTLVTLTASAGTLDARDLDPVAPGVQVAIENGETFIALIAPQAAGEVRITAVTGALKTETAIRFLPDLSPLLAVGAVEGVVGLGREGSFGRGTSTQASSFEAGIDQFASARRDGKAMAAAHGSVFARGRVRDDLALTLGYDSDRDPELRSQRDMQPEAGYPLFGDGATRGYDAQSTGRLYARLDRGESSILYGDFVTREGGNPQSLAAYHRSLTGARTHWEQRGVTVDAFSSRDRSRQRVEELRGLGISGPYALAGAPIVENSERVEIVVRDRHQPAMVVSRSVRQRFVDYELEPFTGRLTFRAPVPGVDAHLDPVSIQVTYESEGEGEAFWVSGIESRVKLGTGFEVGGTYVDDHAIGDEKQLRGFSMAARLGAHSKVETEFAATQRLGFEPGYGSRFELTHESVGSRGRVWLAATGARFDNAGAGFAPGRTEGGARWSGKAGAVTRLNGEALWSADATGQDRRAGVLASFDRPLGEALRGEMGMRFGDERRSAGEAPPPSASVRSRLTLQMPKRPDWSGYAEIEQDVREIDRRMLAVGGEHRFNSRGRFYARHELVSSLHGPFAFNAAERQLSTVAGIDADVARETHVFSEYRLGDSFAGREAQAAVGLRNGWRLDGGVRLGTSFERVSALGSGNATGAATAASVSLEQSEDPNWKGSTRFEIRSSRASDSYLQTIAAAVRLDSSWTALFRQHLDLTDARSGPGAARLRLQLGAAWRPGGAWDALGRMEFRYDRDGAGPDGSNRLSQYTAPGSRRRIAQILALQTAGRLDRHFNASLAWAGKLARDEGPSAVTRGGAQWARARTTLDLAHGWDTGLQASTLIGDRFSDRRIGLGAELGRQMSPGVWLSLGYNHFGYHDEELTGVDWTRSGAYLRIRAKFDERLFGMLPEAPAEPVTNPASTPSAPSLPRDYTGGDPR